MAISAQQVKGLRERTGAGMMDCKRALEAAGGDFEKAILVLREKGVAEAREKSVRKADEGVVTSYIHGDGRIGVLLELACETDFVARNEEFRRLARELAMQVAAMSPIVVRPEDLSEDVVKRERELYLHQCADKPENIRERMVTGKLEKFFEQVCLLRQPYIRDDSRRVEDVVKEMVAKLRENIEVRRFVRMELGHSAES
jgi:elongation factor Ts